MCFSCSLILCATCGIWLASRACIDLRLLSPRSISSVLKGTCEARAHHFVKSLVLGFGVVLELELVLLLALAVELFDLFLDLLLCRFLGLLVGLLVSYLGFFGSTFFLLIDKVSYLGCSFGTRGCRSAQRRHVDHAGFLQLRDVRVLPQIIDA